VEFVVGDFVFFDEFLNLLEGPVGEWVDFVVVVGGVPFDDVYRAAVHSLIAPQAGDPGVERYKCTSEWFDFTYSAAEFPIFTPHVKKVVAFFFDHFCDGGHIGVEELDIDAVAEFDLVEERIGFGG